MAKKLGAKKALLMSALSLLLCCSMLVGTTFAWFTDSVSSTNNIIKAGNLDVELYYQNDETSDWTKVTDTTNIFKNTLWEPGHTEVVKLKVVNEGTLALKYNLGVNIASEIGSTNVLGKEFKLSDYIKYGVVEGNQTYTRDQAVAAVDGTASKLSALYSKADRLAPKGEAVVTMVVYMPTSVDNAANYDKAYATPVINLGVNLFATQVEAEKDSFDEYYDENAAAFTVAEANAHLLKYNAATLVNCVDPNGILNVPDGAKLTLVNSTVKSVQGAGSMELVILGDVVINAKGVSRAAFDGSAISANGKLTVSGKGNLTAIAADVNGAFGIGGMNATEVTIKDITIDYVSGSYADFVADTAADKYLKKAPEGGAAIGSGYNGAVITLDNVTVTKAIGGSKAAGIGARYWTGVTVNITDSELLYVQGGASAAGIGGSRVSSGASESGTTVNITNSTVTAVGGAYGAGIGSGYDTHCLSKQPLCTINIEDSTINATGGQYAAGVGTGYHNAALAGEIKNSTVNAKSGEKWYKDTYTAAMDIGFGVTDPAREGQQTDSKIVYNGTEITLGTALILAKDGTGLYVDKNGVYYILSVEELKAFAAEVNKGAEYEGNTFTGKTVVLMADLDLGGAEWTAIGGFGSTSKQFKGTFDGRGYTISNFKITEKAADRAGKNRSSHGLFGNVNGTIKNLTVANAYVKVTNDGRFIGAVIGRLNGGLVENCKLVNSYVEGSVWQIGGIVGQVNAGAIQNCVVEDTTVVGKAGGVGAVAGFLMEAKEVVINDCTVKNCEIKQSASYGEGYDDMFAAVVGCVNNSGATLKVNNCTVENTIIKGVQSSAAVGYIKAGATVIVDGVKYITTADELKAAVAAGGNMVLGTNIALSESISISNANFVLDGNGHTITMTADATNTYALFDITGGSVIFKNVTFDGIKGGAVVRTVNTKFTADNVTAINGKHTQIQGLFRLLGESTIENCTFKNNTCNMVITLNYDSDYAAPQVVKNCVFENNTCNDTAAVYYVDGTAFTADGNKFVNNTVSTANNGATVYVGFMENVTITNNLFQNNAVTSTHASSKRVAGALMVGYEAVISGNAFIGNTVTGSIESLGNDVCASVYYTDIDLSGNYWGGNAPVAGDDYYQEYTNHSVIVNDYLTVNPF